MPSGDVSNWIALLKGGREDAAQHLWERYFESLVRFACAKLRAVEEAEDAALSAFHSFCRAAADGRFPRLSDRDGLWRLLLAITTRKVTDHVRHQQALKRGALAKWDEAAELDRLAGPEPTPEFAATVVEESQRLLAMLGDPGLRQIALWKLEGYTNAEIGARLGRSLRTVANKLELIRELWRAEAHR
jgi:RNA polymerase sigma factor (sigma-70 family)